jgi:hypothetical protein
VRWFLLWTVLVVLALVVWTLLGRHLWLRAKALGLEARLATERFEAVTVALGQLQGAAPDPVGRGPLTAPPSPRASAPEWDVRRRGRRVRTR